MTEIFRTFKNRLSHYPPLLRFYRNAIFIAHALRNGFWKALVRPLFHSGQLDLCQSVMEWEVTFPEFRTPVEMAAWLRRQGIHLNEGKHTVYLPPQKGLMDLMPSVVCFYPPNSGFKILKDFRSPSEANYVARQSSFLLHSKFIGRPQDQLVSANYLYSFDLGSRVWDVTSWKSGSMSYSVFVVAHVDGDCPSDSQCANFKKRLKKVLSGSHLSFVHPEWEKLNDFKCPSCNNNLLQPNDSGYPKYVDFQNFVMNSPRVWSNEIVEKAKDTFHFGLGRPFRGEKYLYQSISEIAKAGKRNMSKRWYFILKALHRAGIDLKGRIVLDVGCNAGMIMHLSLVEGAAWGLGWDRPGIVDYTEELLLSLGSSRFSLTSADLGPTYGLEKDIPLNLRDYVKESVVYYLSVRQHIGLLGSLAKFPWRVLVYEGHQKERLEEMRQVLNSLITNNVRLVFSSRISDGDSSARPICVLLRKN